MLIYEKHAAGNLLATAQQSLKNFFAMKRCNLYIYTQVFCQGLLILSSWSMQNLCETLFLAVCPILIWIQGKVLVILQVDVKLIFSNVS